MTQKDLATTFLQLAATGRVREAYAKCIAATFIHHNQYFKGDRESLLLAMEEAHQQSPNKGIEIQHVVEEGNMVVTHSLVRRGDPNLQDVTVFHMFRFENGKVVELWDVGQLIEKDSPNENGP